jgi:8-oxo-dGTP pyrophosphatase MutT (NUDIX family)
MRESPLSTLHKVIITSSVYSPSSALRRSVFSTQALLHRPTTPSLYPPEPIKHFRCYTNQIRCPRLFRDNHILIPTLAQTAARPCTMSKAASKPKFEVRSYSEHKSPKPASPSASTIVVSPTNEILLLHRVQTSSAFPSAHVFPGGNLEASDGELPADPRDVNRHRDSLAYRTGAIRELFEETGVLLARSSSTAKSLLRISRETRRTGREDVHGHKIQFKDWLKQTAGPDAVLDTDRLIPFSHWVTPPNVPKRFTTQMYIYFVDPSEQGNPSVRATADKIETMAPEWRTARDWLSRARSGEIILFPPQFLLLYLASEVLDGPGDSPEDILRKRDVLKQKIADGRWGEKYISPIGTSFGDDGRSVLVLDKPGPELKDSGLKGDDEYVVLVKFRKEGPRDVEVGLRKDVLKDRREQAAASASKL